MSKFKHSKPQADLRAVPDPRAVEAFAAGAVERGTSTVLVPPWTGLDPKATPTKGINLRLNEYELTVLRCLAQAEDRSIQRTIKRLIVPALEAAVNRVVE